MIDDIPANRASVRHARRAAYSWRFSRPAPNLTGRLNSHASHSPKLQGRETGWARGSRQGRRQARSPPDQGAVCAAQSCRRRAATLRFGRPAADQACIRRIHAGPVSTASRARRVDAVAHRTACAAGCRAQRPRRAGAAACR
eukprot:scaffold616_cov89-Phaeocystis_antarctica.AAC.6